LPAGALVRVVGCLAKNAQTRFDKRDTTTAHRQHGIAPDEATRPLGESRSRSSLYLPSWMPTSASAVLATGLLIGVGGINGLNVSTVTKSLPIAARNRHGLTR